MKGIEYVFRINPDIQQKEIAQQLGISPKTINNWVKGRSSVPEKYLYALEEIFNLNKDLFNKDINWDPEEIINYIEDDNGVHEVLYEKVAVTSDSENLQFFKVIKESTEGLIYVVDSNNLNYTLQKHELYEIIEPNKSVFHKRLIEFIQSVDETIKIKITQPMVRDNLTDLMYNIFSRNKKVINFFSNYHCSIEAKLEELLVDQNNKFNNDLTARYFFIIEFCPFSLDYGTLIKSN